MLVTVRSEAEDLAGPASNRPRGRPFEAYAVSGVGVMALSPVRSGQLAALSMHVLQMDPTGRRPTKPSVSLFFLPARVSRQAPQIGTLATFRLEYRVTQFPRQPDFRLCGRIEDAGKPSLKADFDPLIRFPQIQQENQHG